ncbi:hypothetical protein NVP1063O_085 [Vibrio phage 1.063.O._10N.261.45.C7]|nr:hypothetical protein NVP1063O_085 [Vibrio phage 1.063.O._10N.261.45.C7]
MKNNRKIHVGQVRQVNEPLDQIEVDGCLYVITRAYEGIEEFDIVFLSGKWKGQTDSFGVNSINCDIVVM